MLQKLKSIFSSGPKTAFIIFIVIVIWLVLGLLFKSSDSESDMNGEGKVSEKSSAMHTVLVEVIESEFYEQEISILGQTEFSRKVLLKALVEGTVISTSNKEGQLAKKGQTILKVDDREVRANFEQANALFQQKQKELSAFEKLLSEELISESKFSEAKSQYESAKAQKIKHAIQLEQTRVTLPFDGLVQKIMVDEGAYINKGQDLVEILDVSPFIVKGSVSEKNASSIKQGQKAYVKLVNGERYEGKVSYLSKQADNNSRSFALEVEIANPENMIILSGVSSTITLPLALEKAHKIASSTLEIDSNGDFSVKVLDAENKVRLKSVKLIKSTNDAVWITGLEKSTSLIIQGQGFVKEGDSVEITYKQKDDENKISTTENKERKSDKKLSEEKPKEVKQPEKL